LQSLLKGYGRKRRPVSLLAFPLFVLPALNTALASVEPVPLRAALERVAEEETHTERPWQVLLHYKASLFGGESLVDDPLFFLSADGKTDPRSELEATLRGFFRTDLTGDEHPQCRFPARYEWLRERLALDRAALPQPECAALEETLKSVDPRSATMVFATFHPNSPASMFGHTFIRIESGRTSKLVAYAANYAAQATDTNGLLFAFKGIFGFYYGYVTVLPYYEKIKEYNDMDQRDLWEYELDLTEGEVRTLVLHIWELKEKSSYYYFFTENCSYTILFLLEAARPTLNLTDGYGPRVLPVDTVRAIRDAGLVTQVSYRPSRATRIRQIASLLDRGHRREALRISRAVQDPAAVAAGEMDTQEKIKVLDLAVEHLQLMYSENDISKEDYTKRFLATLRERGKLGKAEAEAYDMPRPPDPVEGHLSSRLRAATGINLGDAFVEIGYRPAYHELTDPSDGFLEGSEIEFLDVSARYYVPQKSLRLESADVISITSITPWNEFFRPVSWKVYTGATRELFEDEREHLTYRLYGGPGIAVRNRFLGLSYLFAEWDLRLTGRLRDNYAIGAGGSAGFVREIGESWKAHVYARSLFYEIGDEFQSYVVGLDQSVKLGTNSSLTVGISGERAFGTYGTEVRAGWNVFF
jgi:hypothetical protein